MYGGCKEDGGGCMEDGGGCMEDGRGCMELTHPSKSGFLNAIFRFGFKLYNKVACFFLRCKQIFRKDFAQ